MSPERPITVAAVQLPAASAGTSDGTICADAGRHPGIALARVDLAAPRMAADFTRSGDFVGPVRMLND